MNIDKEALPATNNYELHLAIQQAAFKRGYPKGFACWGGHNPHHSFELNRGKCFWCGRHINEVAKALSIPIPQLTT